MAQISLGNGDALIRACRLICKRSRPTSGEHRGCYGNCASNQGLGPTSGEDCPEAVRNWSTAAKAAREALEPHIREMAYIEFEEKARLRLDRLKRNGNANAVKFTAETLEIILTDMRKQHDAELRLIRRKQQK